MAASISPSKISAWLECAHTMTLHHLVESGELTFERGPLGEMAEMLMAKGQAHEDAVLARYVAEGRSVFRVAERSSEESFEQWVERVGNPMADGWDVIYQLPMVHDGVRGVADFLVRVDDHYEAVDAKLARQEAKPGHVLQLCFYADALEALTGVRGEHVHLALGSGRTETIRLAEVDPYWRRIRSSLMTALADPPRTTAEKCSHCDFCEFHQVCNDEWRAADSLVFVAGARRADRDALRADGVTTLAALAEATTAPPAVDAVRFDKLVDQARLQLASRVAGGAPPAFELLAAGTGWVELPEPDEGDVFLDFEGHPFWTPERGLFFLLGLIQRSEAGDWEFVEFWAHDRAEEAAATKALIDHLAARRQRFGGMHVYHYNHTERSSLEALTTEHAVAEVALDELVATGAFVDLYPIVTGSIVLGAESYGLKHVELLTDYERGHDIDQGAGAVVEYERWMTDADPDILRRIADYNEDDVRATLAVRDWLVAHRPAGSAWRVPVLDIVQRDEELDRRIDALHAFGADAPEHLMGDLLGYWRREKRAVAADVYRLATSDVADRRESPGAIADLEFREFVELLDKRGKPRKWPAAVFTYPAQPVDAEIERGADLIHVTSEQEWTFFTVDSIDRQARELRLTWTGDHQESGFVPTSLTHYVWFREGAKIDALESLADELLASTGDKVAHALLRREPPAIVPDIAYVDDWVEHLDGTVLPVQGPPGTGKTYTGARLIRGLVKSGKRVGVTAMSHLAIENLLRAVAEHFDELDDLDALRAVHKHSGGRVESVSYVNDNGRVADGPYDIIGGTPWLFASTAMRNAPVDVLVVDEAGQLGLADTMAAAISAKSVVLLGDPQQLPQVSQASHPNGSGASALAHLLDGDATISPDRGAFLDTTWRMHSDVSHFISDVLYEGRLHVDPSCDGQSTEVGGTGLRWIEATHHDCSTSSAVEAELIAAQIRRLMNTPWTDRHGNVEKLRPKDFMVVAPYNDQVRTIREVFSTHKRLAKVEVGTVDKFQGREAAIVFFSMTTSSSELMPRAADFLFSRNRLNVAISRARCLAYLVCTDALLSTRAKTVDDMKLIGSLCAFVERADAV
ncbi:MAG: TM0106 family RecB-like putative nuclease [Ilumatobacter sp.]|uniref:TM0106 family RecB-like putative nuclease n=1 Tax=Ilumatobacter sp. TaxID=1967498 RepID=UPI00391D8746